MSELATPTPVSQAPAPQNSLQATSMPPSPAPLPSLVLFLLQRSVPHLSKPNTKTSLSPQLGLAPKTLCVPPQPHHNPSPAVCPTVHTPGDFSVEGGMCHCIFWARVRPGTPEGWLWWPASHPLLGTYCVPGTGNNMNKTGLSLSLGAHAPGRTADHQRNSVPLWWAQSEAAFALRLRTWPPLEKSLLPEAKAETAERRPRIRRQTNVQTGL